MIRTLSSFLWFPSGQHYLDPLTLEPALSLLILIPKTTHHQTTHQQKTDQKLLDIEQEYSPEFIKNMLPRIDFEAFTQTARSLGFDIQFSIQDGDFNNLTEDQLMEIHSILMQKRIVNGEMVCPGCQHSFPIKNGIPNMLLNENEV